MKPTIIFSVLFLLSSIVLFSRLFFLTRKNKFAQYSSSFAIICTLSLLTLILTSVLNDNNLIALITGILFSGSIIPLLITNKMSKEPAERKIKKLEIRLSKEKEARRTYEEKYWKLFERSENSILLLDPELQIKEANITIKRHLGRTHASVVNHNFRDLIDSPSLGRESGQVGILVLEEQLKKFLSNHHPIALTLPMKNDSGDGSKNFRVTLEFLKQSGKPEVLASLTPINTDTLTGYLVQETQKHQIDNQIITVDDICKRLTRNLIRYTSENIRNQILLGLREIVLNALEHGNLEIDFKQKTEALENRSYMQLLNSRLQEPKFNKRKITIEYTLKPKKVSYVVKDEGKGFNFEYFEQQKHQKKSKNKPLPLHGRGIMMTKNVFDQVIYKNKGTEVHLEKKL